MGTPSSNQYFEALWTGPGTPSSPNLFTAAELVAGSFDSAAVSAATSAAVSTVNAAAPDSTSISQARSQAVSAATNASIADSKAVSNSVNVSVADSKAISVSGSTSIADSKAVSVATAPPTLTIVAASQSVSTADSKAVSVSVTRPTGSRIVSTLSDYLVNNAVAHIDDFAAVGATDHTTALTNALAAADFVQLGAKTYTLSAVTVSAGKTILTQGYSTILQQKSGVGSGIRMLNITGSNVVIGDMTVKGNISTDTNEQNHSIFVSGSSAIRNISIGNINGQDIRGDVVYLGGTGTNTIRSVTVGKIYGDNIYRNVVSITGAEDVTIQSAVGDRVGLNILDIEPDPGSAPCKNIRVGYIRGSAVSVLGNATVKAYGVEIGFLDLDSSFQTNSSPAYASFQTAVALQGRNNQGLRVRYFKANSYTDHAFKYVYSGGAADTYGKNIVFDYVDWTNCSTTETTYHASALIPQVTDFEINGGTVTHYDVNKKIALGDSSNPDLVGMKIHAVTCTGMIARYAGRRSDFDRIFINNAGYNTYAFLSCQNCSVRNSDITMGSLAGFSSKMSFTNVKATVATSVFDGSNLDHWIANSSINGTYYASGPYQRNFADPIIFGGAATGMYLWVDSAARLRVKNGAPISDTDGTIVGTQT